jgi:REP element-mobilizing transposase RayT
MPRISSKALQVPTMVTFATKDLDRAFSDPKSAQTAVECLYRVKLFNPFTLYGFVVMPDHCHFLLETPRRMNIFHLIRSYQDAVSFELGRPVWEPTFSICSPSDVPSILRSMHENPVQKNLCDDPLLYPWSSASGRFEVADLPLTSLMLQEHS